jgi:hypothetical protein
MPVGETLMNLLAAVLLAAAAVTPSAVAAPAAPADDMVPFVISQTPNPASLIALKSPPITVDAPALVARDGHFFAGDRRVRVWGVNLCFGASFPTHADAERMAARLAAAGVNSVRFHHMDTQRYPNGILDPEDPLKLSAEALERLDYLIDQLARHGIYANLNLHVGRSASEALGMPKTGTEYDKIVGIFTPRLVEAQQQYARDLLTHVNAYRKVRYADDPAVGFVEITNEDSFFMWDGEERLRGLPDYYAKILREQYAAWLKARYKNTAGLGEAWSKGAESLGENMLPAKGWQLEQHEECKAAVVHPKDSPATVRLQIEKADGTNWHLQYKCLPLAVKEGRYYTISFRARADGPRELSYGVGQNHEPWSGLGLWGSVKLTKEWQTVRAGFVATATDDNVRLSFSFGGSPVPADLADVTMAPGGREGLGKDEKIEDASVALYGPGEVEARAADRMRFLAETEKAYFDGMRTFIKKDLGAKALVTGTIVFGPLGLYAQSDMDYVDAHAYWHHPNFPGRPWDPANWTVEQVAMVDKPKESTLPGLSACRLEGKPFTVSEYNHPAPNDYQAECVPMLSSWAAAHDWDGVWLFAYSHTASQANHESFDSFFDIDANPAKWGFMPAGALIFRDGGIPSFRHCRVQGLGGDGPDPLGELVRLHRKFGSNMLAAANSVGRIGLEELLNERMAVTVKGRSTTTAREGGPPGPEMYWLVSDDGKGWFNVLGKDAGVQVGTGTNRDGKGFASITWTPLDGKPLRDSRAILVTACGRCENTGMQFSADRRTVGRIWGKAPVCIEPVEVDVSTGVNRGNEVLAHDALDFSTFKCVALAPDGTPRGDVKTGIPSGDDLTFKASAKYKTMWYLVTRTDGKDSK